METEDSLVSSRRVSEGWGFQQGSPRPRHAHHKTGSVSFQNALHDLQRETGPGGLVEEGERRASSDRGDPREADPGSGARDSPPPANRPLSTGTEAGPSGVTGESGDRWPSNRAEDATTERSTKETSDSLRTTGSPSPHPPNATSPRQTNLKSTARRSNSQNVHRKTSTNHIPTAHPKAKPNLLIRDTGSDTGVTDKSQLSTLRKSPKSTESSAAKAAGMLVASPANSPKLPRRKSAGVGSPSLAPGRRLSAYDEPTGLSDTNTRRIQRPGVAATHSSVPSPSSPGRSEPSDLRVRRYSSVNLPPIAGATRRRHSSVIPAPGLTGSPAEPAKHIGPLSPSILASTFGGQDSGGAARVARQRRVSQAVDELLHIEEVRRASELRVLAAPAQPGERGYQSRDLGDTLQGLKDCRYLRGSNKEEESV